MTTILQSRIKKLYQCLLGLLILFCLHTLVYADPLTNNSPTDIGTGFNNAENKISAMVSNGINGADYQTMAQVIFICCAVYFIVTTMMKYTFLAVPFSSVMTMVFAVLFVKALMVDYDPLTNAAYGIATGIANALQKGMIGTTDPFFAPEFLAKIMSNMTFAGSGASISAALFRIAVLLVISLVSMVLSAVAFSSSIWGFWGYSLLKTIGLVIMPTMLVERFSFVFDGWLRSMVGFLVFLVIARVNCVMVAELIAVYFNTSLSVTAQVAALEIPKISSLFEVLGLFIFSLVAILSLFATAKFASGVVAGAGAGGMGGAVISASRMLGGLF